MTKKAKEELYYILDELFSELQERTEPTDMVSEEYQQGFEKGVEWAINFIGEKAKITY